MVQHLENGTLNLDKISQESIEDLVTRTTSHLAGRAFSSNTRLGDGSRGVSDLTSTEATMFARERPIKDELSQRVKHIERLLTFIDVAAAEIQSNITEIYRVEEEKKQRPTSTPCLICDINVSELAGYCRPCYDNWNNYGRPDRLKEVGTVQEAKYQRRRLFC